MHLLQTQLDDSATACAQHVQHGSTALRLDRLGAEYGKASADRHQHVRVINRSAGDIGCFERSNLIIKSLRKLAQRIHVSAWRKTGVSNPVDAIEHQAAGALEEFFLCFAMSQVDRARDMESVTCVQRFDDIEAPLQPAVRRQHRVQDHCAIGVETDPVVREDRIGRMRLERIFKDQNVHPGLRQGIRQVVELHQRCELRDIVAVCITVYIWELLKRELLEPVGSRSLLVAGETHRTDHQDIGCCLGLDHECSWFSSLRVVREAGGEYSEVDIATCRQPQRLLDFIPYKRMVFIPMQALSSKQLEVLAFIQQFMETHALPPTRGEIAQGLGLKNRQGIDQHLRALEAKGALDLTPGISRGIRVREASSPTLQSLAPIDTQPGRNNPGLNNPGPSNQVANQAAYGLPLLGRIAAGSPILAEGNIEERIQVDPALFRPRANFVLRVRGDSMKDAGIQDRDLLAVHQTTQVRPGQIVVARIGDEATVKYYHRQGHAVRLEPANAAYQPIEIDLRKQELTIEGLAVGVIRTALLRTR